MGGVSLDNWKFELLFLTLSVGRLISIVTILFAYGDKPLSDWHAFLRPNSVVSILSTVTKAAMLMVIGQGIGQLKWVYFEQRPHRLTDFETFDGASRGPYGSMELLFKINWRAFIASLGALTTLLALALDLFAQQALSIDLVTFNDTRVSGSLQYARLYDTQSSGRPQVSPVIYCQSCQSSLCPSAN